MPQFDDFAINFDADVFQPAIVANGYSIDRDFGGTIFYKKNGFEIDFGFSWEWNNFYLSGEIDIPTQYESITIDQLVAEIEQYTPFLTQEMIDDKYPYKSDDRWDSLEYYLGGNYYDYYFFIEMNIVNNKLQFVLGVYEYSGW